MASIRTVPIRSPVTRMAHPQTSYSLSDVLPFSQEFIRPSEMRPGMVLCDYTFQSCMGPHYRLWRIIRVNKKTITVERCNMHGVCEMESEPEKVTLFDWIDFSGTHGPNHFMKLVTPQVPTAGHSRR